MYFKNTFPVELAVSNDNLLGCKNTAVLYLANDIELYKC